MQQHTLIRGDHKTLRCYWWLVNHNKWCNSIRRAFKAQRAEYFLKCPQYPYGAVRAGNNPAWYQHEEYSFYSALQITLEMLWLFSLSIDLSIIFSVNWLIVLSIIVRKWLRREKGFSQSWRWRLQIACFVWTTVQKPQMYTIFTDKKVQLLSFA